jgi:hypothetical protein
MQKTANAPPDTLFISWMKAIYTLRAHAWPYLGFILPTPRHLLKLLKEIDKFALMKRPEDPGFTGSNEGPAIRDKAIHRVCDALMFVPAGIDAIVLSKTSHVRNAGHGRKA